MKLNKFDKLYNTIITQMEVKFWPEEYQKKPERKIEEVDLDKIDFDKFGWDPKGFDESHNVTKVIQNILTNEQYAKKYADKIPMERWKRINHDISMKKLLADSSKVPEKVLILIKDKLWDYNKELNSQALTWKYISKYRKNMSPEFIDACKDKIRWDQIFDPWHMSEKDRENIKANYPVELMYKAAKYFRNPAAWSVFLNIYRDEIVADFIAQNANDKAFNQTAFTEYVLLPYMSNPDFYVNGNKDKFNGFDLDFIKKYQNAIDWKKIQKNINKIPKENQEEIKEIMQPHIDSMKAANDKAQKQWASYMDSIVMPIVDDRLAAGRSDGLD